MIKRKRPHRQPRNSFIKQIKKDAGVGSYRELKKMANGRKEWKKEVASQPID